ncbi:hypothetical protein [Gillisia limnaea]|uniref:Uncharacterized protein n=1 Tax=Gillisia limnaea (strain DSM 15749 / LMG 21470 / R-8282) TaxID=865937 RepID=H2C057_GILLR|nr:hypothetical protein [Gillisia limnaea]EHQ03473.1 hypothetical protein Gilli_2860 [Gillisia limnaea DSM 15749]
MERQIKLIWDFRGPDSNKTAEHHEIHLKDFIKTEALDMLNITGVERISDIHSLAFWVVPESDMKKFRDILKPHRATVYT